MTLLESRFCNYAESVGGSIYSIHASITLQNAQINPCYFLHCGTFTICEGRTNATRDLQFTEFTEAYLYLLPSDILVQYPSSAAFPIHQFERWLYSESFADLARINSQTWCVSCLPLVGFLVHDPISLLLLLVLIHNSVSTRVSFPFHLNLDFSIALHNRGICLASPL